MDRRERGPGISTRSDSLPSGTRKVQAFVITPKGLSEAFFLFSLRSRHGFRPKVPCLRRSWPKTSSNMRADAAAWEGETVKRKPS
jgi:hypothetical protein